MTTPHHPEEITAVLSAARDTYPGRRVIAVHQPHTFSRTHSLMKEFAESLEQADIVVLLDIYGVGEENTHHISSAHLGSLVRKPVHLVTDPVEAAKKTLELVEPGDVVMTIGAGTITQVGPMMLGGGDEEQATSPQPERSRPLERKMPGMQPIALRISEAPHLQFMPDTDMSLYTTMRIGGVADFLVRTQTADDIVAAVGWAHDEALPVTMIGGGSNLLVGDDGIRGLVIVARTPGQRAASLLEAEDHGDHVIVTVGAQAPLSWVGRYCAEQGWSGMDWGVGLPGQIGGATVNNAGAHGTELKDHLIAIDVLQENGEIVRQDASWLEASYRMTKIKGADRPRPWTVLRTVFRLPKGDPAELVRLAEEHADFRKRTQPAGACSGSLFANPPGDFAGRLIEEAGLAGYQIGAMQISPKHANWMMNTGGGTAVEAWELIQHVRECVLDWSGIELRPEVERVGEHRN
jgi:UDP-N-acetylmuramate dehydrogenase